MPHICATVVKNVNASGYDSYLQKIKRNNPKPLSNQQTNCKTCYSFIKIVGTPTYDSYLNSIKSNIVKNKSIIGLNLDCNCKTIPL